MRLFIAINFDGDFRKTLLQYQSELKGYAAPHARINWTSPANLHLTLAFIGEYNAPEKVARVLDGIRFKPFSIRSGKCGSFGSLWWVGLDGGEAAAELSKQIRDGLKAAGIPFDTKPMKPHITLVREFSPTSPPRVNPIPSETAVTRVSLMKSERIAGRLTYTEVYGVRAK